jgi:hypothetical protein
MIDLVLFFLQNLFKPYFFKLSEIRLYFLVHGKIFVVVESFF